MAVSDALLVRPLRRSDRSEWARLWQGYLEFYETAVSPEIYDTQFERLLSDAPNTYFGLVAERGDRLVGLTHYIFHAHGWKVEDVCYLQDLYADADARGLGVGRALIEAVYAAADANGTPSVYWLTQEFNQTARHLYDRIGACTPFIKYARVLS